MFFYLREIHPICFFFTYAGNLPDIYKPDLPIGFPVATPLATILGFSRHVAQRGGREDLFGLVLQSLGGFSGLMPVKLP